MVWCYVVCSVADDEILKLRPRVVIDLQRRPTKFGAGAQTAESSGSVLCIYLGVFAIL